MPTDVVMPQMGESIAEATVIKLLVKPGDAVREDQEDPADPQHLAEAAACGIAVTPHLSKGDLLSLVQTRIRAL